MTVECSHCRQHVGVNRQGQAKVHFLGGFRHRCAGSQEIVVERPRVIKVRQGRSMGREARLNAHLNPIERQERNIIRILKSAGTAEELDRMVSAIARLGLSEDYVQAVAEQHVRLKPSWVRQREQHEVYTRVDEIRRRKRGEGGGLTAALDAGKAEAIHEALEDTEDIPVLGVEPRPYVAGGEVDVVTREELAEVLQ